MKQRVVIPDVQCSIIEFEQEGLPGVAFVNIALRNFGSREVFAWHLSVMIEFEDLIENGMPSLEERATVDEFEDRLDSLLKGPDPEKPNVLFLARITWNETRELIWRVYNPEIADQVLQKLINRNEAPRPFDYRMDDDKKWELAEWSLREYNKQ